MRGAVRLTDAQASFLEIEILGRFDEDPIVAALAETFASSEGRAIVVADPEHVAELVLEVLNMIDDAIDAGALHVIGGVDTAREARGIHRAGSALLAKLRAMRDATRPARP